MSLTHKTVIENKQLGNEFHGALDPAEMELVAGLMLQDETVKEAVARLELPAGAELVIEPWMYGTFMRGPAVKFGTCTNDCTVTLTKVPTVSMMHDANIKASCS